MNHKLMGWIIDTRIGKFFVSTEDVGALRYIIQHDAPKDPMVEVSRIVVRAIGERFFAMVEEKIGGTRAYDEEGLFLMNEVSDWLSDHLDQEMLEILAGEDNVGHRYRRGDHPGNSLLNIYWDGIGPWQA